MPSFKRLLPSESKFYRAVDFDGGSITATIKTVGTEVVGGETGEVKLVLTFEEPGTKKLTLNLTRAEAVADIAGSDNTDDWPGTRIQIVKSATRFQGKRVPCMAVERPSKVAAERRQEFGVEEVGF